MRGRVLLVIGVFFILLSPSVAHAHDQKEYIILITEDGQSPASINPGILVETDTIFFRNVDDDPGTRIHRILVDADGDGEFEGIDDFSTEWISSSCSLNETGQKVDDSCNQHALILLDPSNRLLPGNISMIHQIKDVPKEYNILITEEGLTPASINPSILHETDTLFFRNVDERQNVQHRILVDADGDGVFEGIDDFSTEWISSSCSLNETGQKVDDSCNQHALILLDPSNRLLPGNISMIHQIKENNETVDIDFYINFAQNIYQTVDIDFYINFAQDIHVNNDNAPTGNEDLEEVKKSSKEQILEAVIFISILIVFFVGLEIVKSEKE